MKHVKQLVHSTFKPLCLHLAHQGHFHFRSHHLPWRLLPLCGPLPASASPLEAEVTQAGTALGPGGNALE